jgi:hypothetical protein
VVIAWKAMPLDACVERDDSKADNERLTECISEILRVNDGRRKGIRSVDVLPRE